MLKEALSKEGIRYQREEGAVWQPLPARRNRRIPTQRAAARAGVLDWYHTELEELAEYQPDRVVLPLDQQIGAACQPVVRAGDQVSEGQLVARCPEGRLGANLHASITGTVEEAEGRVVIRERRG